MKINVTNINFLRKISTFHRMNNSVLTPFIRYASPSGRKDVNK